MKKKIALFVILFLLFFLFSFFLSSPTSDEIWNYGFSYNIASGLVPYVDFGLLQTPLYFFYQGLALFFFGSHLVVFHLANALLTTITCMLFMRLFGKNCLLLFCFFLEFWIPTYSLMCLTGLGVVCLLEKEGRSDFILGIVLGLLVLTKQNIGVVLLLVGLCSKSWNTVGKRCLGAFLVGLFFFAYLFLTQSFAGFVNYAVLGVFEFTKNTLVVPMIMIVFILGLLALAWAFWKYPKDRNLLKYIVAFQIMAVPLFDGYHVLFSLFPIGCYFLSKVTLPRTVVVIGAIAFIFLNLQSSYFTFSKGKERYSHPISFMTGRKLNVDFSKALKQVCDYIDRHPNEKVFFLDYNAFLVRLELGQNPTQFDYMLEGNMGYHGVKNMITSLETICSTEKCTFIFRYPKVQNLQLSDEIIEYVRKNYSAEGKLGIYQVYQNESRRSR